MRWILSRGCRNYLMKRHSDLPVGREQVAELDSNPQGLAPHYLELVRKASSQVWSQLF
jgi:hypothetical protein